EQQGSVLAGDGYRGGTFLLGKFHPYLANVAAKHLVFAGAEGGGNLDALPGADALVVVHAPLVAIDTAGFKYQGRLTRFSAVELGADFNQTVIEVGQLLPADADNAAGRGADEVVQPVQHIKPCPAGSGSRGPRNPHPTTCRQTATAGWRPECATREIGRASCRKERRARWAPRQEQQN